MELPDRGKTGFSCLNSTDWVFKEIFNYFALPKITRHNFNVTLLLRLELRGKTD